MREILIIVKCGVCSEEFEAHRECDSVRDGRTYCERHSVLRGAAWWLMYKKGYSAKQAGAASLEEWDQAKGEMAQG